MLQLINKFKKDPFYYLLLFFSASICWNLDISTYIMLVLGFFWIFEAFKAPRILINTFKTPLFYLVTAPWLWSFVGLLYSDDIEHGLFIIGVSACMFFLPLFLHGINQKKHLTQKQVKYILFGIIFSSTSCALFCFTMSFMDFLSINGSTSNFYYIHLTHVNLSPGSLGNYTVFSLFIILLSIAGTKPFYKQKNTALLFLLFLINFLFLYFLQAKAAILAFIFGGFIFLFYVLKKKYGFKFASSFTLVLFFIFSALIYTKGTTVLGSRFNGLLQSKEAFSKNKENSTNLRLSAIHGSIDLIKNNFWIGVGTGAVKTKLIDFYKKNSYKKAEKHKTDTHNQFFRSFAKHGVIGFILVSFLFFIPFYYGIKQKSIFLLLFGLLQFIMAQTGDILDNQPGVVFHCFVSSILFFIYLDFLKKEKPSF